MSSWCNHFVSLYEYRDGTLACLASNPILFNNVNTKSRCMDDRSLPGGVRTCPACRSAVEPGHKFCPACGTQVPELPRCRACGAQFIAPVKFCEMCGAAVDPSVVAGIAGPGPAEADEPVFEPEPGPEPEETDEPAEEPESVYEQDDEEDDTEQEPVQPIKVQPIPVREIEPLPVESVVSVRADSSGGTGVSGTDPLSPAFSGLSDGPERKAPAPQTFPLNRILIAGGIVLLLLVIAAAVWFIGLPMLKGGAAQPASSQPPAPVETREPALAALPATMPPTPVQTAKPGPVPTTEEASPGPVATQMMPENQVVYFDVQKDQVNAKITTIYQRGPGENVLNYAEVKVTYPDGTVKSGIIKPSKGDTELILQGSKGIDRVEVVAYLHNGIAYRIKDEMLAFQALR